LEAVKQNIEQALVDDCVEVMKLLARGSHGQPLVVGANLTKILRHHPQWGDHLGLNEMSQEVCYDRVPQPDHFVDEVQEWLQDNFHLNFNRKEIQAKLLAQASNNPFHPVREYLNNLPAWDGTARLKQVAKKILHVEDSALYTTYITKWSIGAVRRVKQPGCKMDTILVLSGPQATMKSSFFDVLGGEFFNDSPIDMNNKDGYMVLHRAWISELSEIDHATTTTAVERIKAFVSSRKDAFRAPYAVSVAVHPRTCVLVGTTNRDDYLTDPSGSRRFWTIKVTVPADLKLLRKWRDQLWAEAVGLEAVDIDHWLGAEDEAVREADAEQFECVDPWEAMFLDWVERNKAGSHTGDAHHFPSFDLSAGVSLQQLMDLIEIPKVQQNRPASMRLAAILRKHGWEQGGRDSSRSRLWSPKKSKRAARAKK
jgi:putative DNA primase/helicase